MCKLDHKSKALKFQCCSQPDTGRISWIKTAMSTYPNYFLGTKVLKSFGYEMLTHFISLRQLIGPMPPGREGGLF